MAWPNIDYPNFVMIGVHTIVVKTPQTEGVSFYKVKIDGIGEYSNVAPGELCIFTGTEPLTYYVISMWGYRYGENGQLEESNGSGDTKRTKDRPPFPITNATGPDWIVLRAPVEIPEWAEPEAFITGKVTNQTTGQSTTGLFRAGQRLRFTNPQVILPNHLYDLSVVYTERHSGFPVESYTYQASTYNPIPSNPPPPRPREQFATFQGYGEIPEQICFTITSARGCSMNSCEEPGSHSGDGSGGSGDSGSGGSDGSHSGSGNGSSSGSGSGSESGSGSGSNSGSGSGSSSGSSSGSGSGSAFGSSSGSGSGSGSHSGSGSGTCLDCYVPPQVELDESTLTISSVEVIAPSDVPQGITLILQIRADGETNFTNYAVGIVADQRVLVSNLASCSWFALRWRTQSAD